MNLLPLAMGEKRFDAHPGASLISDDTKTERLLSTKTKTTGFIRIVVPPSIARAKFAGDPDLPAA
jgi:hypothetical protein